MKITLPLLLIPLLLMLTSCSAKKEASLAEHKVSPYQAPDTSFQDLNGKTWRISELQGKPVVLNFWATWCPPCREEFPSLNNAWAKLKDEGVIILAANVAEDEEAIQAFMQQIPLNFPVLQDYHAQNAMAWGATALPITFIIDRDGQVVYKILGAKKWDEEPILDAILSLK